MGVCIIVLNATKEKYRSTSYYRLVSIKGVKTISFSGGNMADVCGGAERYCKCPNGLW